jgi:hypothetical protein
MHSFVVAGVVFVVAFGGAMLGMLVRRRLPAEHVAPESRDVIRLGTGLVATMAALVLGLLVASAQSAFVAEQTGFEQMATNFILIDRALVHYGPEAYPARQALRATLRAVIARLWPDDGGQAASLSSEEITADGSSLYTAIRDLAPQDDNQRGMQAQALQFTSDIARTRWTLTHNEEDTLSIPFLIVLTFWLWVLFSSFGLFAPRNATVVSVLCVSALSVAGAILLIVDLSQPFEGLVHIPSTPLRHALTQITRD